VRLAQARVARARAELAAPVSSLLQRARERPLMCVGAAAAGGFVMGRLALRPWRVPGVFALLSGEAVGLAAKAIALAREFHPVASSP
jgi:hypothetical protein